MEPAYATGSTTGRVLPGGRPHRSDGFRADRTRPQASASLSRTSGAAPDHADADGGGSHAGHSLDRIRVLPEPAAAAAGLVPNISALGDDIFLGGRTLGEFTGDVARPVGTSVGNIFGRLAGAVTGVSISSNNVVAPAWAANGAFDWQVGFATTGRNGWIVQEINNAYRAQDATGAAVGHQPTPRYWEAWGVDNNGAVTPSIGPVNDIWRRANRGAGTQGHWSMTGNVYWTTTDPATPAGGNLAGGTVPDAGILLSTTAKPPGLGVTRLHRYAQGHWDMHRGSAGP